MNGEESEANKIVAKIKEQVSAEAESTESPVQSKDDASSESVAAIADEDYKSDITQYSSESTDEGTIFKERAQKGAEEIGPTTRQRRSTRSTKGGKKAG